MVLTTPLLTGTRNDIKDYLETIMLFGAIGEDNTVPTAGDTELGSEILRLPIDDFDKSVADAITASLFVPTTAGNGSVVRETGWFDSDEETVDDCDVVTGWTDNADMTTTLNNTTFWQGTGSLDLTKDGVASVNANTFKTVTSVDFTNKNQSLILYIIDSTTLNLLAVTGAVTVRFGSDASNYYEWVFDRADLVVGKNLLNDLKSSNADSTTGTPVLTAMDYFFIQLTSVNAGDTWSAGDVIMDDIKIYGGTLYTRNVPQSITKVDSINLFLDTTITITVTEV